MSPDDAPVVIQLSPQEVLQLDILLADRDAEQAFAFLRLIRDRVCQRTQGRIKSHLDQ